MPITNNLFPHLGKPFLKWAGGKRQLINDIYKHLPADFHLWKEVVYIEPFVGGGAVLFFLLNNFPNIKQAIINDINPRLINLYRVIQSHVEELIVALEYIEQAYFALETNEKRKEFFLFQRTCFNSEKLSPIEDAACFIFLNRTCFNGLFRMNSKGAFNVPFGNYAKPLICDKDTLRADHELLKNVVILQGDFAQTAKYVAKNTFIYLDPPYRPISKTSTFNEYFHTVFNDAEQERLAQFCRYLVSENCKIMQSNSDPKNQNPNDNFFENLYQGYSFHRIYAKRAINSVANKRGKISELLITNY